MVQRSVGQHDAEFDVVWGNSAEFDFRGCKYDGTGNRCKQRLRASGKLYQSAGHLDIPHHQGEGFFFPILAISQSLDGCGIPGIACQVVSTQTFYSQNPPGAKNPGRLTDAVFAFLYSDVGIQVNVRANLREKIVTRAASWTSYRLGMKTTVAGIAIFRGAIVVEQPVVHGGVGPVVRQRLHDGVTRPAIGTVDVRVQVARIGGVEKFFETVVTNGKVR